METRLALAGLGPERSVALTPLTPVTPKGLGVTFVRDWEEVRVMVTRIMSPVVTNVGEAAITLFREAPEAPTEYSITNRAWLSPVVPVSPVLSQLSEEREPLPERIKTMLLPLAQPERFTNSWATVFRLGVL